MKEKVSNECATILRTAKSRKVVVVYLQQILKIKVKQCKRQAHRLHVLFSITTLCTRGR